MVSIMAPADYFPRPALPTNDLAWPPAWYFPPPTAVPADDLPLPPAKDWDCSPPPFDSEEIQPARDFPPPAALPWPPAKDWDSSVGDSDFSRPTAIPVDDLPRPPAEDWDRGEDCSPPRSSPFQPARDSPSEDFPPPAALPWPPAKDWDSSFGDSDFSRPTVDDRPRPPAKDWDWGEDSSPPRSSPFQPARETLSSLPPPTPEESEEKHQAHHTLGLGLSLCLPKDIHHLQLRSNLKLPTIGDFNPFAKRMRAIQDLMHYSLDNPAEPIPRHALISFVNAIAKRRQYLIVKEYLTKESTIIHHDSSVDVILDTLIKAQILDCRFSKFNREAIWMAIHDRISEVRSRYRALMLHNYKEYLQSCCFIKRNSSLLEDLKELAKQDSFLGLNSHDKKHELKIYKKALFLSAAYNSFLGTSACEVSDYYPCELPSENEKPHPPSDLIDNLVYKTLELGYIMDPNPETELAKIKYSDPFAFNAYFILVSRAMREYPKYELQRGTVRVENVSFDVSKKTIRRFFSQFGHVVDVELTSGDKSQTAFVTFSNAEPIEAALNLKDPVIENQPVRIVSIHEYRVKFLKAFSDEESAVVKDDDDMLHLLTKYWYYSKPILQQEN